MRQLPPSYAWADLRNNTPVDGNNRIGVGFNVHDGTIVRLSLRHTDARALALSLLAFLRANTDEHGITPTVPAVDVPAGATERWL